MDTVAPPSRLLLCGCFLALPVASPAWSQGDSTSAPLPFYVWDSEVPAKPGVLLRQEPLEAPLVLENAASGVRILYSSESFDGSPVAVSGAVFWPKGMPPADGWPLLAWSHGTVGIADLCAPSSNGRSARDVRYLSHWLSEGYAIVATDYEGLGTPGPHPYLHCKAEAFGNIDAVRAAQQIGAFISQKWIVTGQSQGGQGALCTGAYATQRAPELDFLGTLATAPGVNFLEVFAGNHPERDEPMRYLGIVLLLMRGMDTYTPTFSAEAALTEKARSMLHRVEEACLRQLLEEGARLGLTNSTTFVTNPLSETPGIADAAVQMEIPRSGWDRPVLIGQGTQDSMTPVEQTRALAASLCEAGVDVTLKIYEGEEHSGPMNVGRADFSAWLAARFAGEPPTNTCAP
jgi:pimeloyl-ACP methyl ester carboxylesterase